MRWKWWRGCVTIHIEGFCLDDFLDQAWTQKLVLMDCARPRRTRLTFRATEDQRAQVLALAERLGLSWRIVSRYGLPALGLRAAARPALCLSLALGLGLAVLASCRIWEIRVEGAGDGMSREILRLLDEKGLGIGALREAQDVNALEYAITAAFPELRFAGIRLAGMRAKVTVAMKAPAEEAAPCDLYAARDGLVTEITAAMGTACVAVGQRVRAGELLIRGVLLPQGQAETPVTARGEVRGYCTFSGSAALPVKKAVPGEKKPAFRVSLWLGDQKWAFSLGRITEDHLPQALWVYRLPGALAAWPFSCRVERYCLGIWQEQDFPALLRELEKRSLKEAVKKMPADGEIIRIRTDWAQNGNDLTMETTVFAMASLLLEE